MKKSDVLFLSVLFIPLSASSLSLQKTVQGTIHDAHSRRPLPAANIRVLGALRGVITNTDGSYLLQLEEIPATIAVSYIGYRSDTLQISTGAPEELDIFLQPTVIHLEDMTITAENPAVAIMRRVIANKTAMRQRVTAFRADAYSRLNVQNDTAIVMIMESRSHLYWQRDRGTREVVLWRQQTENLSGAAAAIGAGDIPNFYDDDIRLLGYTFIGPTHPQALDHYHFELIDRRAMDGDVVYDLAVRPKSKRQPTFVGQLSVLDKKFVLLEVDLEDNGALPPQSFLQEIRLQCRQQFRLFADDYWLPVDWHESGSIRVGMTGLQFPTIHYVRLSSLDNYSVNLALPDTIFATNRIRRVPARSADSLMLSTQRAVPLTIAETMAYKTIDSSRTLDQYFKPSGFLARFAKMSVRVDDRAIDAGVAAGKKVRLSGSPQIWYNRVEGLHAGVAGAVKLSRLTLSPQIAYLGAMKDWSTGLEIAAALERSARAVAAVQYVDAAHPLTEPGLYPQFLTAIPTLLAQRDYYDYYRRKGFGGRLTLRSTKLHLRTILTMSREAHNSLAKHSDFDLLGETSPQRPNPPIAGGVMTTAKIDVAWGETTNTEMVGQTGLRVQVERGVKNLWDGDFDFTRYNLIAHWRVPTFLRRRPIAPAMDLRLVAGEHSGSLPPQRLQAMDGLLAVYSPFGCFRTLQNRPVYSGKYAALFWEHSFRTWPFEALGLHCLSKQGYNLILHGAHGKTWDVQTDYPGWSAGFPNRHQQHHEVGLSLSGLFSYFRLDVTKSFTGNRPVRCGISLAKLF